MGTIENICQFAYENFKDDSCLYDCFCENLNLSSCDTKENLFCSEKSPVVEIKIIIFIFKDLKINTCFNLGKKFIIQLVWYVSAYLRYLF